MNRVRNIAGQEILPGMEAVKPPAYTKLNERAAAGRITNPEYWGIASETLQSVETADLELVTRRTFLRALYTDERGTLSVDGVTLNAEEYSAIPRSVQSLAIASFAKTLKSRQDRVRSQTLETAKRSASHTLENSLVSVLDAMIGLDNEFDYLDLFYKRLAAPGYAHTSDAELRQVANQAYGLSFNNILKVSGDYYHWSEETRAKVENGLAHRLLTGPQNQRIKNFKQMTSLALQYSRRKSGIFGRRLSQIFDEVDKIGATKSGEDTNSK